MALNAYNAAKHHIGLRTKAGPGTLYGFQLLHGYTQELQREGAGAPDFGGATDLIGQSPSVSRLTQDDFIGGGFQWNWGRDDAMFADSLGFIPDPQGRALISCPPMYHKHNFDPDVKAGFVLDNPKTMFMVGGAIFVVFGHGILRYDIDLGTETWVAAPVSSTYVSAGYEMTDGLIYAFCNSSVPDDRPFVQRIKLDLSAPVFDEFYIGPTGTENMTGFGMTLRDSNLVVQIGRKIWIGDPPDNHSPSVNGAITWTKVGRAPGRWIDSQAYNGLTYILLSDGSFTSQIIAYDGDGLLPITTFPTSFYGKCMIEYAGRIFVGGTGTDVNGGELYAELYEVTGASVRTVRTFSPETRTTLLNNGWPNVIDDLVVHEGLLWFSHRGKRVLAYDVTSDGFFGGSEILNASDTHMYRLVGGRGRLWGFGVSPTDDTKHGIYRIAQPADAGSITSADWNPTIVTSDFAYEPGMKKRWSEIRVMHRYGTMTSIEYSTNSGTSWTALTLTTEVDGQVHYTAASLVAIAPSRHIRFRFKLDSTDGLTYHKELIAYTLSFVMLDTGKYAWSFVVNGSEEVETDDAELDEGVTQTQDVSEVAAQLAAWAVDKTPLLFTDVDEVVRDVQIVGYRRTLPIIGPAVDGAVRESHHALTLIEV